MNTPENPTDEALVNLASSLTAFCSLTLNDAALEGSDLTILSGYALVQAPMITENDENVACAQANLVLMLDGQEIASAALTMAPGETDRSYDASITDMSFTVPEKQRTTPTGITISGGTGKTAGSPTTGPPSSPPPPGAMMTKRSSGICTCFPKSSPT